MALQMGRKYDVVVAGGGTAGVGAALAAARAGARTLLVEESGYIGGMATMGSLPFFGFHNDRYEQVMQGIPWEIMSRLMKMGAAAEVRNVRMATDKAGMQGGAKFNVGGIFYFPEAFKYVVLEMMREAGVELLLHTYVSDAVMEGNAIAGLVVENKSGRTVVSAERVVDCTGDADVAARAGVPFEKGRPEDGLMQPMSLLFIMCNIDLEKAEKAGTAVKWEWEAVGSDYWRSRCTVHTVYLKQWSEQLWREFPEFAGKHLEFLINTVGDGVFYCGNRLHIARRDATDADQLTQAEVLSRRLAWRVIEIVRDQAPGFENAHIISTPPRIGIRETRRIVGEYCLTLEDVLEARKFDDGVVFCGNWVDVHDYGGASTVAHPAKGGQVKGGSAYAIPYRCLVPLRVDNLLVAGRSISATQGGHASFRIMGTVMSTGQAAGAAAALSVQRAVAPRKLDYQAPAGDVVKARCLSTSPSDASNAIGWVEVFSDRENQVSQWMS